jgi:hypothetical protein
MIVEDEDFLELLEQPRATRPSGKELQMRKLRRAPPGAQFVADLVESLDESAQEDRPS